MNKKFYPRGDEYFETTSQKTFFQIRFWKDTVVEGEVKKEIVFKSFYKMKKNFDKMLKSGVDIYEVVEWNLPEDIKTLAELASDIRFYECSKSLLGNDRKSILL